MKVTDDEVPRGPRPSPRNSMHWKQAITTRWIWIRSLKIGAVVGALQVLIHQGDVVLSQGLSRALLMKSIVSPLLAFAVAFYATVSTHVDQLNKEFKP